MKYYSEVTKKMYDSENALKFAELEVEKRKKDEELKKSNRAARAKEVEAAIKAAEEANKVARKKLTDFCTEYGQFHTTLKGTGDFLTSFFDELFRD